jgi:hypothetical protein
VVLSPFTQPGSVNPTPYNHYSLLRSIEDVFGLTHLGFAAAPGLQAFGADVFNAGSAAPATTAPPAITSPPATSAPPKPSPPYGPARAAPHEKPPCGCGTREEEGGLGIR